MYLIKRVYRETNEGRETIKQFLKTLFYAKVPVALQNGNATEITTKRLRCYRDKQVQTIKFASSGLDKEKKVTLVRLCTCSKGTEAEVHNLLYLGTGAIDRSAHETKQEARDDSARPKITTI